MKKQGAFMGAVTTLGFAALVLAASPAGAQSGNNLETIRTSESRSSSSCPTTWKPRRAARWTALWKP